MAATLDRAAQPAPDSNRAPAPLVRSDRAARLVSQGKPRPAARAASAVSGGRVALGPGAKLARDEPVGLRDDPATAYARRSPRSTMRSNGFARSPERATTPPWPTTCGSAWPKHSPTAPISSPAASDRSPHARIRGPRACSIRPRPKPGSPVSGTCSRPTSCAGRENQPTPRKRSPPPSSRSRPSATRGRRGSRSRFLIDQKRYDDAIKALDASPLDKPVKALWMVRVRLAELDEPARRR